MRIANMLTLQQAEELYEQGVAVIVNDGKEVLFEREKEKALA